MTPTTSFRTLTLVSVLHAFTHLYQVALLPPLPADPKKLQTGERRLRHLSRQPDDARLLSAKLSDGRDGRSVQPQKIARPWPGD
jgi:hypothetical protein